MEKIKIRQSLDNLCKKSMGNALETYGEKLTEEEKSLIKERIKAQIDSIVKDCFSKDESGNYYLPYKKLPEGYATVSGKFFERTNSASTPTKLAENILSSFSESIDLIVRFACREKEGRPLCQAQ